MCSNSHTVVIQMSFKLCICSKVKVTIVGFGLIYLSEYVKTMTKNPRYLKEKSIKKAIYLPIHLQEMYPEMITYSRFC
ncbi:hypothetical protein GWI33_017754 [Rhynchophorus ferrugineus]|uniref:Uncharacterized protein n=2 Tax=Rhynchophorus ferrugineus TaxID=354439 RepID=A0A834HYN3_RHYFE|nr:hypothetical protein GWI33_017754 [Rhynchophorus ferrugineus]